MLAWAAYGIGFWCKGHEKESVTALVARALTRDGALAATDAPTPSPARLDADAAIRRAIGRCGAEESEPTLVAWLAAPRERAIAAALGLGDLASAKQKLREETLAALLNLAAGSASTKPVTEALFAVGRLDNVPLTVVDRIREVATARLTDPSEARSSRCAPSAAPGMEPRARWRGCSARRPRSRRRSGPRRRGSSSALEKRGNTRWARRCLRSCPARIRWRSPASSARTSASCSRPSTRSTTPAPRRRRSRSSLAAGPADAA